ncbi:MAG TPA: hypothetical protein VGL40_04735, partial [Bacillota bacterium]
PIIDTVPTFLDFWDKAGGLVPPLQLLTWEKEYYEPNRQVFDLYFTRWADRSQLPEAFARYPKSVTTIRALAETFPRDAERIAVEAGSVLAAVAAVDVIALVGAYGAGSWSWPVFSRPAALVALESFASRSRLGLALAHEIGYAVAQNAAGVGFGEVQRYQHDLLFNLAFEGLAGLIAMVVRPGLSDSEYAWPSGGAPSRGEPGGGEPSGGEPGPAVPTAADDRLAWCRRHRSELLRSLARDSLANEADVCDHYFGPNGDYAGRRGIGQWLALEFAREALDPSKAASLVAGGVGTIRGTAADWIRRAADRAR